jgi:hypothetical protein
MFKEVREMAQLHGRRDFLKLMSAFGAAGVPSLTPDVWSGGGLASEGVQQFIDALRSLAHSIDVKRQLRNEAQAQVLALCDGRVRRHKAEAHPHKVILVE